MIRKFLENEKRFLKDVIILHTKISIDSFLDEVFKPTEWIRDDFREYMGTMGKNRYTTLQWYKFFEKYADYAIEKINKFPSKDFAPDSKQRVIIYPDYYDMGF